jgi:hypothetical protein
VTGRHRAAPGALTEPMKAVNPPINPEPETATMPAVTADDIAEFERRREEMTAEQWMEPLRHGGSRVEARMRQTFRERGLILAKRVGRKALRLRAALAKGGRS